MRKYLPGDRRQWVAAVGTTVAAGLVVWGVTWLQTDRSAQQQRADDATVAAEDLCAQVRSLGWACVHDPADLQGAPGPVGPAGRGIVSATCTGGQWVVRFSDGDVDYSAGPCVGERGLPGASGAPGEDGSDGEDGQSVTGPSGPPGATGADGRGIQDVECRETPEGWRWWVEYSDGTTDEDAGPCYSPGLLD